jgi:hypothetical protein
MIDSEPGRARAIDIAESIKNREGVPALEHPRVFDHLSYLTPHPYGLVFGFETALPAMDSSSAILT